MSSTTKTAQEQCIRQVAGVRYSVAILHNKNCLSLYRMLFVEQPLSIELLKKKNTKKKKEVILENQTF